MKHYTSVEFLSIFRVSSPPAKTQSPPGRNAKPPYRKLSGDGFEYDAILNQTPSTSLGGACFTIVTSYFLEQANIASCRFAAQLHLLIKQLSIRSDMDRA